MRFSIRNSTSGSAAASSGRLPQLISIKSGMWFSSPVELVSSTSDTMQSQEWAVTTIKNADQPPSPLISMLSHLNSQTNNSHRLSISFLYSSRLPQGYDNAPSGSGLDQILFLPRLRHIIRSQAQSHRLRISLELFLTNDSYNAPIDHSPEYTVQGRRINDNDLRSAVLGSDGNRDPRESVCYICGPPAMTDQMVHSLQSILGENWAQRVFYEKWW